MYVGLFLYLYLCVCVCPLGCEFVCEFGSDPMFLVSAFLFPVWWINLYISKNGICSIDICQLKDSNMIVGICASFFCTVDGIRN